MMGKVWKGGGFGSKELSLHSSPRKGTFPSQRHARALVLHPMLFFPSLSTYKTNPTHINYVLP